MALGFSGRFDYLRDPLSFEDLENTKSAQRRAKVFLRSKP